MALLAKPLTWERSTLAMAGTRLEVLTVGTGQPLLVLHDEMGAPDVVYPPYQGLAEQHKLVMPVHPGFGGGDRLDWLMNVQGLAIWYLQALRQLDLGRTSVLGVSLGGWLAAEMATMCPHVFDRLVLVSPMGVKPPSGDIFDLFIVTAREYFDACFARPDNVPGYAEQFGDDIAPERAARIEDAREAAVRIAWKPYMHNPALPHLLPGVRTPTLIVAGREDRIVPLSAAEAYLHAIPDARLEVVDDAGHRPDLEQPDTFLRLVQTFLSA